MVIFEFHEFYKAIWEIRQRFSDIPLYFGFKGRKELARRKGRIKDKWREKRWVNVNAQIHLTTFQLHMYQLQMMKMQ
jgi:hypothetical protein